MVHPDKDAKLKYFESRYKAFKELAEGLTIEQFAADTDGLYRLRNSLELVFDDCVHERGHATVDGCIVCDTGETMDRWIRGAEPGAKRYLGGVVRMHT